MTTFFANGGLEFIMGTVVLIYVILENRREERKESILIK